MNVLASTAIQGLSVYSAMDRHEPTLKIGKMAPSTQPDSMLNVTPLATKRQQTLTYHAKTGRHLRPTDNTHPPELLGELAQQTWHQQDWDSIKMMEDMRLLWAVESYDNNEYDPLIHTTPSKVLAPRRYFAPHAVPVKGVDYD